jgi:hypothetical protein
MIALKQYVMNMKRCQNEFIQKLESSNREVIDIKFSTYKDLYFNVLIIHDDEKSNGILEVWR